jgi:hypothetical protein
MIQTLFLKSISCHLAPKISPERQAVKIANSRALGEIPFLSQMLDKLSNLFIR